MTNGWFDLSTNRLRCAFEGPMLLPRVIQAQGMSASTVTSGLASKKPYLFTSIITFLHSLTGCHGRPDRSDLTVNFRLLFAEGMPPHSGQCGPATALSHQSVSEGARQ